VKDARIADRYATPLLLGTYGHPSLEAAIERR